MNRTMWLQDRRMQKFEDVLLRWQRRTLTMVEAGELLGMSERQFRRYRDRYEEEGVEGLLDRRLGKPSSRRVPMRDIRLMLHLYENAYRGWNVKHFHEHLVRDHNFQWGYTFVKTQLQVAGLVPRAPRRGAHRRKRERKPCEGMMLHQDGSRAVWLDGPSPLDLIVTMDDATSTIYSAILVEEEGTTSTFRALLEVFGAQGLPSSLYTDRGSHYFYTPKAGEEVDKTRLTQVGRALARLAIDHIPAYSPEARGRSERMFGTLQDRLPKELKLAGIRNVDEANRFIRNVYLPAHNTRFARPPAIADSAFVPLSDPTALFDILCVEEDRIVARDNTVSYASLQLQLPASPGRPHYVRARVKAHQYPDGALAVFHGPRRLANYAADGNQIVAPTAPSLASCSPPSRPGLPTPPPRAPARRPASTPARHEAAAAMRVGTKKRAVRSNKETNAQRATL
jgi:hypothetical protein